jgi:hypothetical protein
MRAMTMATRRDWMMMMSPIHSAQSERTKSVFCWEDILSLQNVLATMFNMEREI